MTLPVLAPIAAVRELSPADDAGFYAGCAVTAVDGRPVRDILDWRWLTAGDAVELSYIDGEGDAGTVRLERDGDEDWGLVFQGEIFDAIHQCRNACTFCFMRQLPKGARASLSLRDDDFRLSFLQGTFVTFTNMGDADVERIIEQRISPLRWSMHAISPELRRRMIGPHAQHGMDVAQRLLSAGIELEAQIVLVPGENDGAELERSLAWAWEQENILSVGIVPLGYTRHQARFRESFDAPEAALRVVEQVAPWQERAQRERGRAWAYPSDEFYCNAYAPDVRPHIPPAEAYGDFSLFEDGIGIVRSFLEDWSGAGESIGQAALALRAAGSRALYVCGTAMRPVLDPLVRDAGIGDVFSALYVENRHFGGNVNVTGLLCADDMAPAIARACETAQAHGDEGPLVLVPRVVLNADGVTLDDATAEDIARQAGWPVHVVSCDASGFMAEILQILKG